MMKKYYYDDPLAAAWMAKHFRIQFEEGRYYEGIGVKITTTVAGKFYIHPDSIELLEPQEGDLIIIDRDYTRGFYPSLVKGVLKEGDDLFLVEDLDGEELSECYISFDSIKEIIQRNSIPFMWPKEEV